MIIQFSKYQTLLALLEGFKKYTGEHYVEVQEVYDESRLPMSDDIGLLKQQLSRLCVLLSRLIFILAEINGFLIRGQYLAMAERGTKGNMEEKKIRIKDGIVDVIAYQHFIDGLVKVIKTKISVGQSLLKGEIPTLSSGVENEGYIN